MRAASVAVVDAFWVASGEVVEKAVVSRPVVKARGPAPERTMAVVEGEEERWVNRV